MISVIIPVYNEDNSIVHCVRSLLKQSYPNIEIIIVDDGSHNFSASLFLKKFSSKEQTYIRLYHQDHLGPAIARNLGAKYAKGEILVFVDADMTFEANFIHDLVLPIEQGRLKGTFSREEFMANSSNEIAICWNINRYIMNKWHLNSESLQRVLPSSYPHKQQVFRAILKKEFLRVGGYDSIGYTDDWTLSRKLGYLAQAVYGAKYYHVNPSTWQEVRIQARWIGQNEFIVGSLFRKVISLIRYNFIFSIYFGVYGAVKFRRILFIIFKLYYDFILIATIVRTFWKIEKKK